MECEMVLRDFLDDWFKKILLMCIIGYKDIVTRWKSFKGNLMVSKIKLLTENRVYVAKARIGREFITQHHE